MGTIANCKRCGRIFVKEAIDICPTCMREIEEEYQRCSNYLREHKLVTLHDLSKATDVSVKQITQFIREGRISIADNPNMTYSCESCGAPIREGRLCKKCTERLNKGIKQAIEDRIAEKERKRSGYYQIGQDKNKDK